MIQHFVAFRFRNEVPQDVRAGILTELAALPDRYTAMRNFRIGRNQSNRDDRFEFGFTIEFDAQSELDAYLTSEYHEAFVAERFRPNVAERAIVSFTPDEGTLG
jgi:hypothetical protein